MLVVENLEARYGMIAALRSISLRVDEGRLIALLGANGAGKTTALRAISGLLRPAAGTIRLFDRDVTGLPAYQLAKLGIAHVPEGRGILTRLSVEENLLMGAYLRKDGDIHSDLEQMLKRFPVLGERRKQAAGTLSGGEQQMLAIARALMARPKLLLLDEPSMGLAPQFVARIFELLQELRAEGATILLVEQNARMALQIADYAYVIASGRLQAEGPATELAASEEIRKAYLGGH